MTSSTTRRNSSGVTVQLSRFPLETLNRELLGLQLTLRRHWVSADKTIAFVEGANHGYTTCTRCEQTPGQYGDTLKTTYDYVDGWLSKSGRF